MDLLLIASGAIGWVMPLLVAVVVRSKWPNWVKGVVALLTSVILGAVSVATAGDLSNPTDWLAAAITVLTASQVAYHTWWKPTGIAPAIERNTQPTPLGLHAETNALASGVVTAKLANPARVRAPRQRSALDTGDTAAADADPNSLG